MSEMFEYLLYAHLVFAFVATVLVFKLDYFERKQAVLQSLLSFTLPIIGSFFVLVFLSVVHRNMTTRPEPGKPNHNNKNVESDALYVELDSSD